MTKSLRIHRMYNLLALVACLTVLPPGLIAQDHGTFKDSRDNQAYNWVKIGSQTWMTENLRFKTAEGSWIYSEDSANESKFGRLFSWKSAQTACPKGWHLPSEKEWNTLVQSLGGNSQAGMKFLVMDSIGKTHAIEGETIPAPKPSLLGGVRHPDGSYTGLDLWGGCWTSGKVNDAIATNTLFAKGSKDIGFSTNDKNTGFTIRCIKGK